MTTLRTLKKLVLGETWLLPLGVAVVVLTCAFAAEPLLGDAWESGGGFLLLGGVIVVLLASVARSARR